MFTILSVVGLVAAVTVIVAKAKNVTLDEALKSVGDFVFSEIRERKIEPSFTPDAQTVQKVVAAVCSQSRLSIDDTAWNVNTAGAFPVMNIQLLPINENSITIARNAAANIISNTADILGISVDIETDVLPLKHGAECIQVGIASTDAQKQAMADYRNRKNESAVMDAGGGGSDVVDADLEKELSAISSGVGNV